MLYYESAGAEEQALDGIVMIIGLTSNNVTFQSVFCYSIQPFFGYWICFLADTQLLSPFWYISSKIVCYLNTYGKDFNGGLFHFKDGEPATIMPAVGVSFPKSFYPFFQYNLICCWHSYECRLCSVNFNSELLYDMFIYNSNLDRNSSLLFLSL